MAGNLDLHKANKAKNDEFYTQYEDIQKEMNAYLEYNPDVFRGKVILLPCDDPEWSNFTKFFAQNFENFGLKKLISTSYAPESKKLNNQPISLFEQNSPQFDTEKTNVKGKIFVLERDINNSGTIDIEDLEWEYLEGDGDFRSEEVRKLRDEADIIITNPPFSLYREFVAWIFEAGKQFSIIGNQNSITYKEIFPLLKDNKMWMGESIHNGDREFRVPNDYDESENYRYDEDGNKYVRVRGPRWFTNIEHGRRHQPLKLMTKNENLKFSSHKEIRERGYPKYDNYNAIDVAFTDAIPADCKGVMGVPITFMDKYNPEQFDIIGLAASAGYNKDIVGLPFEGDRDARTLINGKNTYARIFIRRKR